MKVLSSCAAAIVVLIFTVCLGPGCLLDETQCGSGWVSQNGVCVPEKAAGQYNGGSPSAEIIFENETTIDTSTSPSQVSLLSDVSLAPDGLSGDAGRAIQGDRWAEYSVLLCVDQSAPSSTSQMGSAAGIDLDAVLVVGADGEIVGLAERVVEGLLIPSRSNSQPPRELAVTLGEPDGRAVSLGGNGAYVRHEMALNRTIRSGDIVKIVDIESGPVQEEIAEIYLCKRGSRGLSDCENLGLNPLSLQSTFLIP